MTLNYMITRNEPEDHRCTLCRYRQYYFNLLLCQSSIESTYWNTNSVNFAESFVNPTHLYSLSSYWFYKFGALAHSKTLVLSSPPLLYSEHGNFLNAIESVLRFSQLWFWMDRMRQRLILLKSMVCEHPLQLRSLGNFYSTSTLCSKMCLFL